MLSVHFTVIPDAEWLLLVDKAEDSQVTSLVQKLLCGETLKTEDFPGGDRSFCPKLEVRDAQQDEKSCPIPVHQRNLRPRKAVPVELEEASSSGNSEEGDPPCSERCTHENLKRWMSKRFEKLENKLEELRKMNCRSLGMPEGSNHTSRKRKASDDPQLRQTFSPDSIDIQTEWQNRKGKKRKTVVTRPDEKKTLSRRRSERGKDVSMETIRNNPASSQRETGHQNESDNGVTTPFFGNATLQETRTSSRREDDQLKANESANARFPPPGENKGDHQQETQSNLLVPYGDVLDVEPKSYVLPAEIPSTFQYEVGSPIAWEKTNPNCYRSVGSVRSFHPSWNGNPSSKPKETSAPKGGGGGSEQQQENESVTARTPPPVENDAAQRTGTDNAGEYGEEDHDGGEQVRTAKKQTQSVGHESCQTSNLEVPKSGETLEKVPSPMVDVEAIVKEINSEFPATEEDERYDSCKDDMSTDSQIQENRGNQVSELEADSDVVASGGKRHRMISSKITGVYTPNTRVKKLFKSEEKHEYKPIERRIELSIRSLPKF
ncbi:hypothetical protein Bca52824_027206 [Brassica carinata]|uniref:Uncharacterized protein n=1 Tax=Brassica carinata TaxID=52824 RepID=A0A8X7SJ96_BRACI|nr:hypothetical protein Bca52824_027206 [Brassica carinata]